MVTSEFDKRNLFHSERHFSHDFHDDHLSLTLDSSKLYLQKSFSTKIKSVFAHQDSTASLSADDVITFYERIGSLPNLERFQVSFVEGLAVPYLALANLLNQAHRLHQFDLNCFDITAAVENNDPNELFFFIESLRNHPSLKDFKLCFSHQAHGATTLDLIFQALVQVPTLQKLVLYVKPRFSCQEHVSTRLSHQSTEHLCFTSSLKTLKMYGITLHKEHVCLMAKSNLRVLSLLNCGLKHEFAIQLASMLEMNNTLQKVDLSRNYIGDIGCIAIAKALEKNSTLQGLYLYQDKKVRKQSCQALEHMLERNFTLQDLWTSIDDEDFKETVNFYLNLNRQGTRHILRNIASTKEEWAATLSSHQNDLSSLFYYLSRNPLLFCI